MTEGDPLPGTPQNSPGIGAGVTTPTTSTPVIAAGKKQVDPLIMGGVSEKHDGSEIAWTGGKPMADWKGLVIKVPFHIHPTQFHPTTVGSSTKAAHYHTVGMDKKFGRKGDVVNKYYIITASADFA